MNRIEQLECALVEEKLKTLTPSDLDKMKYFFYEWLIIAKKMTEEKLKALTSAEFYKLRVEFARLYIKTL